MSYTTKKSLLRGVIDNDKASWEQFQEFYTPLIYLCGHDCNLTAEEIQDLRQEVLLEVYRQQVVSKYDNTRGKFRAYLREIIRRKAFEIYRARIPMEGDATNVENIVDNSMSEHWEEEWHQFLQEVAMQELKERVSESTYLSFDLYVNRQLPVQEIVKMLHVTENQIYVNRTRCLRLLTEIIARLKEEEEAE